MDAEMIADRIALLLNPMPDMSGRQINRFHGERRRRIEGLAAEIAGEAARFRLALEAIADGEGDAQEIARQTLAGTEND